MSSNSNKRSFSVNFSPKLAQIKLISDDGCSIFRIAKEASSGIEPEFLIIFTANSLIASSKATNTRSSSLGNDSVNKSTLAIIYGSSAFTCKIFARCFPCKITVVDPSGISKIRIIRAIVPIGYKSVKVGSSTRASRCVVTKSSPLLL